MGTDADQHGDTQNIDEQAGAGTDSSAAETDGVAHGAGIGASTAGAGTATATATAPGALPPRRTRTRRGAAAVAGVIALALGSAAIGGVLTGSVLLQAVPAVCDTQHIAETVLPSVVTVNVRGTRGASNGSGVALEDGYILTNDHVIASGAGAGALSIVSSSGQSVTAELVGRAPKVDLAVLRVSAEDAALPAIGIGVSEDLAVGQSIVALGAPLGLSSTVTSGIVSALSRELQVPGDTATGSALLTGAIQVDAPINPGNSGGALVNCRGDLVGINTAIATVPNDAGQGGGGSVGIGFAIPVDLATEVASQLIETGTFATPYFGMIATPIHESSASALGIDSGLFVLNVTPGGPAEEAGIAQGDILTRVGDRAANSVDTLFSVALGHSAGDTVEVQYLHEGEARTATVTLVTQP